MLGIWQGYILRGLLAVYFAIRAFIVSPVLIRLETVDGWLIAMPAFGTVGALIMYWNYRRRQNQLNWTSCLGGRIFTTN
tara:strand:+ start:119 stop:355 length:237 start_codon:yes stop_codon:yes gene_type:complete